MELPTNLTVLIMLGLLLAFACGIAFGAMLSYFIFIKGMLFGIQNALPEQEQGDIDKIMKKR